METKDAVIITIIFCLLVFFLWVTAERKIKKYTDLPANNRYVVIGFIPYIKDESYLLVIVLADKNGVPQRCSEPFNVLIGEDECLEIEQGQLI